MKRALKIRLTAFGLAIGVLALSIGWAAFAGWREIGQLQIRLSTGHLRDFEIADHLQATILKLNNSLVRYDLHHELPDWEEFQKSSDELNAWIDTQKPLLSSARELNLLNQIDAAYDVFLGAATNQVQGATDEGKAALAHVDQVQRAVVPLLGLGYRLEDAHRQVLEDSLVASQRSVSLLRWVIFGSLLLLLGSLGWLSMTVYHEMIAPAAKSARSNPRRLGAAGKAGLPGGAGGGRGARNPQSAHRHQGAPLQPSTGL